MSSFSELKPEVYLIDATAFCYRAFYALKGLSTSWGQPTNAVYGFTNMLNKILKENKPQYLGICFDVSRRTFRQEKYKEYKINRPAMPEGLSSQIPFIHEIVDAYGICILQMEGFEADDIIATVVEKLKSKKNLSIIIISSDKDVLQLVDSNIQVLSPYKDEGKIYSYKEILERYGVEPKRIIDVLALMGDDTDNIPGVPGVGEKTAVQLIKKFGSIDNLIENIDKIESETLITLIKDNIERIRLNHQLLELNKEVPLNFNLDDLKIKKPDYLRLYTIFKRLEFKKLLKELPVETSEVKIRSNVVEVMPQELKEVLKDEIVVIGDYDKDRILIFSPQKKYCFLRIEEAVSFLNDHRTIKFGYDFKKLIRFLNRYNIKISPPYFDVMVAGYLLEPSVGDYSLESLCFRHLSQIIKNPDIITSAELIFKIGTILKEELDNKDLEELFYSIEMPLVEVLAEMEDNGLKFDDKILKDLSSDCNRRIKDLIQRIYSLAGTEFNLNSPKQLREVLFERLKLPVIKKTKTGPSTDEEVLRTLSEKHKLPAFLLDYRQLTKLKSTYLEPLLSMLHPETKKIHTNFSQISTETGRLVSYHPNLQTLPIKSEFTRMVRKAVVPHQSNSLLVSADYSQIELRILAHLSKDSLLVKSFHEDRDIHRFTASLLYGIEEKDVTEEMRDLAKRINFGIIYGLSSYGLAQELGISQEEATTFIEEYFLRYPKVKEFIEKQIEKAKKDGFVTTILGRRRYLSYINSPNQNLRALAQRQAINTPIQGSAADLIKLAMINIQQGLKRHNLKAKLILQIHDELLFDIEEKEMVFCAALIKDKMENALKFDVPIKAVIKKGKNWLDMEDVNL